MSAPDGLIPGPDPGACPECGGWRRAGMTHICAPAEAVTAPSSQPDARTALDALLAQVERLEQERDEARKNLGWIKDVVEKYPHDKGWGDPLAASVQSALMLLNHRAEAAEARAHRYREALWSIASGAWMEDAPRHKYSVRVFARRALACDPLVCRDPDLCWGKGTCPRDPACDE